MKINRQERLIQLITYVFEFKEQNVGMLEAMNALETKFKGEDYFLVNLFYMFYIDGKSFHGLLQSEKVFDGALGLLVQKVYEFCKNEGASNEDSAKMFLSYYFN